MGTPKNLVGKEQWGAADSTVAYAGVVASPQNTDCPTCCSAGQLRQASVDAAESARKGPSSSKTASETSGMQSIQFCLQRQGLSMEAASLFIDSWHPATQETYNCYIWKWKTFVAAESLDENNMKPTHVTYFLANLFSEGAGYSAVNTASSALSAY